MFICRKLGYPQLNGSVNFSSRAKRVEDKRLNCARNLQLKCFQVSFSTHRVESGRCASDCPKLVNFGKEKTCRICDLCISHEIKKTLTLCSAALLDVWRKRLRNQSRMCEVQIELLSPFTYLLLFFFFGLSSQHLILLLLYSFDIGGLNLKQYTAVYWTRGFIS